MSLKTKLVLILSAVIAAAACLTHLGQTLVVSRSFQALELDEAGKDLARVAEALRAENHQLDTLCRDWAFWDDTLQFALDRNEAFIESNLTSDSLETSHLALVVVIDTEGHLVWQSQLPPDGMDEVELALVPAEFDDDHPLRTDGTSDSIASGLAQTEWGLMLVSAHPILNSEAEGPSTGTIIMGRMLTPEILDQVRDRTRVQFATLPLIGQAAPAVTARWQDSVQITVADVDTLRATADLADITGAPCLHIEAWIPRSITARGRTALRLALASTLLSAILLLAILYFLLQREVVAPLVELTGHAVAIGETDDTSARLTLNRRDELGILSREFDTMLSRLARSRAALIELSHKAGMSDVATSVLHNVGNALNSVRVSGGMIEERLNGISHADLGRLAELLVAPQEGLATLLAQHPRGAVIGPFLREAASNLGNDLTAAREECSRLGRSVEQIAAMIAAQQEHVIDQGVTESIDVAEQIDAAIALVFSCGVRHAIEVEREPAQLPRIDTVRAKLHNILVNLLQNARHAVEQADVARKRVSVRACIERDTLRIQVCDNGVGIAGENLTRIFANGFSTKASGGGFGLHSAANAAAELGGRLIADSDGPGKGATFALELHAAVPRARRTANTR